MPRPPNSASLPTFSVPAWLPSWGWFFHKCETAAIAFAVLVGLTLVVLGFNFEAWVHEWANFLQHYSAASGESRLPVNLVISFTYLGLFAVIWLGRRPRRLSDGQAS